MKNITICLLAGMLIVIYPGFSSALDFGIGDIAKQYADISWDAMNTLASPAATGDTSDISSGFQTDEGSGGSTPPNFITDEFDLGDKGDGEFIPPDIPLDDSDLYVGVDNEDQNTTAPVPEPATMLLVGTGLVGVISLRKRFGNKG